MRRRGWGGYMDGGCGNGERDYSWSVVLGTVGGRKTLDFGGGIEFGRKMRGEGGGGFQCWLSIRFSITCHGILLKFIAMRWYTLVWVTNYKLKANQTRQIRVSIYHSYTIIFSHCFWSPQKSDKDIFWKKNIVKNRILFLSKYFATFFFRWNFEDF